MVRDARSCTFNSQQELDTIAHFRDPKRELTQRVFRGPKQPIVARPLSPRPSLLRAAVSALLPVPSAHPPVPGLCSVLCGHGLVWNTWLGREGSGAGLWEGEGFCFLGSDV